MPLTIRDKNKKRIEIKLYIFIAGCKYSKEIHVCEFADLSIESNPDKFLLRRRFSIKSINYSICNSVVDR